MAILGYEEIINAGAASVLSDFPILITEANLNEGAASDFWTAVDVDGFYIRIATATEGTGRRPFEVVAFDRTAKSFIIWFKSGLGTSENSLYITLDDTLAAFPAVSDPLGRNAVWSDYLRVYHLYNGSVIDATGNFDATIVGTLGAEAGLYSIATSFSGGAYLQINDLSTELSGLSELTITALAKVDQDVDAGPNEPPILQSWPGSGQVKIWADNAPNGNDNWAVALNDGSTRIARSQANDINYGNWQHVASRFDSTTLDILVDGVETASLSAPGVIATGSGNARIGQDPVATSNSWVGALQEIRVRAEALSDDWVSAENDNQSSPGAFFVGQGWTAAGALDDLDIGGGLHGFSSQEVSLLLTGSLSINDTEQAQSADGVSLTQFQDLDVTVPSHNLLSGIVGVSLGDSLDMGQNIISLTSSFGGLAHFQNILPDHVLQAVLSAQAVLNSGDLAPPAGRLSSASGTSRFLTPTTSRIFQPRT